jgi:TRAP-type C4-dicarboxylate transport system permease large subunit
MTNTMSTTKNIISIVLIAIGAGLVIWGYNKSEGIGSQLSNALTGSHSDNVMMLYIGGAACIAVGVFLYFKK